MFKFVLSVSFLVVALSQTAKAYDDSICRAFCSTIFYTKQEVVNGVGVIPLSRFMNGEVSQLSSSREEGFESLQKQCKLMALENKKKHSHLEFGTVSTGLSRRGTPVTEATIDNSCKTIK